MEQQPSELHLQHNAWKAARQRLDGTARRANQVVASRPAPVLSIVPPTEDPTSDVMDMIIAKVGNAMGLPVNEIVSGVSSPEIIAARRLAMALCVRRPNFSISEVAARFEVLEGSVEESLKGLDGILRTYVITQKTPLELSLPLIVRDWINKVETDRQRPTIEHIQREVCEVFNTRKTDLISARRDHPMVSFRHIGMAVARLLTTHSFSVIGQKFGRRDHTTVLHACRNLKPYTDAASARLAPLAPSRAWITAIGEEMGLLRPQS